MKKVIYSFSPNEESKFNSFLHAHKNYQVLDLFENLVQQLILVENPSWLHLHPSIRAQKIDQLYTTKFGHLPKFALGNWVVFKSQCLLCHIVENNDYLKLRTNRNRGLINWSQQQTLYHKHISVVGLSTGSKVATELVRMGVGNNYRLMDSDEVELHNFNRTFFSINEIGLKKVEAVANQIFKIDPYLDVTKSKNMLTQKNILDLFPADLIIDAFDSFSIKILLRKIAQKKKVPIISGFDIGNRAMIIVERYDLEKVDKDIFLNGVPEESLLTENMSGQQKIDTFISIIGSGNHSKQMFRAVHTVGKKISGIPQISVASDLVASLWTKAIIDIFLDNNKTSYRHLINLDS